MTAEPRIRPAQLGDIDELVALRSEFTFEDLEPGAEPVGADYAEDCRAFLDDAITTGRWHIWVAESEGRIVSHAFVALLDRVPRPIRQRARIGYLTNVYTDRSSAAAASVPP